MVTASSANAGASARQGAADNEAQQIEHGIGAAVEAFRLEKGWSRHKLAMEADLDRSAVFKIEKGQRTPTPGTIAQLATAFGVTITQLSAAAYVAAAEDQAERRNRAAARASILAAVGAAGGSRRSRYFQVCWELWPPQRSSKVPAGSAVARLTTCAQETLWFKRSWTDSQP